jgi:hypothetical protein
VGAGLGGVEARVVKYGLHKPVDRVGRLGHSCGSFGGTNTAVKLAIQFFQA